MTTNETRTRDVEGAAPPDVPPRSPREAHEDELELYGGGHIQARHGGVQAWLLVVYVVLLLWALYYGFTYWGGLGPGLDLKQ